MLHKLCTVKNVNDSSLFANILIIHKAQDKQIENKG